MFIRAAVAACAFLLSTPSMATAIIDTGICNSGCVGVPINTPVFGHIISAVGIKFTTTETFRLTSIASVFSGSGSGIFSVFSLNGSGLPDQSIFDAPFSVPPGNSGFGTNSVSISATLAPGTWALVATPGNGVVSLMTQAGASTAGYTVYPSFAKVDGNWQGLPMTYMGRGVPFALFGEAVPEPATWAMMIGGLGLVGAALRRRPIVPGAKAL